MDSKNSDDNLDQHKTTTSLILWMLGLRMTSMHLQENLLRELRFVDSSWDIAISWFRVTCKVSADFLIDFIRNHHYSLSQRNHRKGPPAQHPGHNQGSHFDNNNNLFLSFFFNRERGVLLWLQAVLQPTQTKVPEIIWLTRILVIFQVHASQFGGHSIKRHKNSPLQTKHQ